MQLIAPTPRAPAPVDRTAGVKALFRPADPLVPLLAQGDGLPEGLCVARRDALSEARQNLLLVGVEVLQPLEEELKAVVWYSLDLIQSQLRFAQELLEEDRINAALSGLVFDELRQPRVREGQAELGSSLRLQGEGEAYPFRYELQGVEKIPGLAPSGDGPDSPQGGQDDEGSHDGPGGKKPWQNEPILKA
jgi:hypothetical protein